MRTAVRWLLGIVLDRGTGPGVGRRYPGEVKERGTLRCGVNGAVAGTFLQGRSGQLERAGRGFLPRGGGGGLWARARRWNSSRWRTRIASTALSEGRIDLLSRNTTWTLSRDLGHGMTFAASCTTTGRASWCPATPT